MSEAAGVRRHFISNSVSMETYSMGRVFIPKNLREYAQLEKETYFLGVGKRGEIWSAPKYKAVMAELSQKVVFETMSAVLT